MKGFGTHMHIVVGTPNGTTPLENSLAVIKKLNIHLPCDPAIPLLDIYSREMKIYIATEKPVPQIFIVALFIIVKIWKYLQLINTYIHTYVSALNTVEYQSALQKAMLTLSDWSDVSVC